MADLTPIYTRADCLAAAGALDGAVHMVDDDESAQILARLADQWRDQAAATPGQRRSPQELWQAIGRPENARATPAQLVEFIRRADDADAESLADKMLQASNRYLTLLIWGRLDDADRLVHLVDTLAITYRPKGVHIWLGSPNRGLDGQRPIDLCQAGDWDRVQECADRIAGGL